MPSENFDFKKILEGLDAKIAKKTAGGGAVVPDTGSGVGVNLPNVLAGLDAKIAAQTAGGVTPENNPTAFAKQRALEYLKQGKLKESIDSMVSDLSKDESRPEGQKKMIGMMGMDLRNKTDLTEKDVRDFIEGLA